MKTARMQLSVTNPVLLYVDGGEESKKAEALLWSHGIPTHVIEGCLDAGYDYPLAQFHPWECEGLAEIQDFLALPCMQ